MNKKATLSLLKNYKKEKGSRYGISALGVFGSVARGESTEGSDVDVVIRMKKPNLLLLSKIRIELEEQFQTHVDLVSYRDKMNPFLKQRINNEAVYV